MKKFFQNATALEKPFYKQYGNGITSDMKFFWVFVES